MKLPFCLLLLTALACPLAQATTLAPGNWQTTVTMSMPGMPFTPPPRTLTHCLTPPKGQTKPSADTMKDMAKQMQRSGCEMQDFTFKDNSGHWKMVCSGQHPGTGEAWITYESSKHYTSKTVMTMHDTGGGKMTISSDSKWLGPCTP